MWSLISLLTYVVYVWKQFYVCTFIVLLNRALIIQTYPIHDTSDLLLWYYISFINCDKYQQYLFTKINWGRNRTHGHKREQLIHCLFLLLNSKWSKYFYFILYVWDIGFAMDNLNKMMLHVLYLNHFHLNVYLSNLKFHVCCQ